MERLSSAGATVSLGLEMTSLTSSPIRPCPSREIFVPATGKSRTSVADLERYTSRGPRSITAVMTLLALRRGRNATTTVSRGTTKAVCRSFKDENLCPMPATMSAVVIAVAISKASHGPTTLNSGSRQRLR